MSKERFFSFEVNCAAVIGLNNGNFILQECMYENKSGYCCDITIGKKGMNNIIDIVKECSTNEEKSGLYLEPKKELSMISSLNGPIDIFDKFTATLEMSPAELPLFKKIAKSGQYLIAFTN